MTKATADLLLFCPEFSSGSTSWRNAILLGCDRPIRCGQRTLCDVPCGEGWVEVLLLCPVTVYTAIRAVALCVMG